MGAVTSVDQVVREDLSNLFINLDERETPFLTKIKRGDDLVNVKCSRGHLRSMTVA